MRTEDVSQYQRFWLNLLQLANIHVILVTLETFHEDMSWLKTMAVSNMAFMLVTFEVSHAPMSSSNSPQQKNMAFMFLTEDVSQAPMPRPSKELQPQNIDPIVSTDEVSHPPRSSLNSSASNVG